MPASIRWLMCNFIFRVRDKTRKDLDGLEDEFRTWGETLQDGNKTWAFWWRFVMVDMQGYMSL
jgi:hypothetical protein